MEVELTEVKKHSNKKDCWVVINGKVYDVTKFLSEHPGGKNAILDFAGGDASEAFEDTGHSSDARAHLKTLMKGTLKK